MPVRGNGLRELIADARRGSSDERRALAGQSRDPEKRRRGEDHDEEGHARADEATIARSCWPTGGSQDCKLPCREPEEGATDDRGNGRQPQHARARTTQRFYALQPAITRTNRSALPLAQVCTRHVRAPTPPRHHFIVSLCALDDSRLLECAACFRHGGPAHPREWRGQTGDESLTRTACTRNMHTPAHGTVWSGGGPRQFRARVREDAT